VQERRSGCCRHAQVKANGGTIRDIDARSRIDAVTRSTHDAIVRTVVSGIVCDARALPPMWKSTYTDRVTDLATIAGLTSPGGSIRERRIDLGWTQAELAERAGVAQADISRIENGRLDARWSTKRSLENGARRSALRKPTGKKWNPKGPIAPIEPAGA
jgi:DNA-binding XRE family transcriptional regulator